MNPIEATFTKGQIVPDVPPDWPEGSRLRIEPVESESTNGDQSETPEQIEEWLRWYRDLEPLEFTAEEEADLARWRQKMKEYELARSQERIAGLFP
jgi:hypothetical protein